MAFIAQVFSLFRKLTDVNWASITSSAPFLKYDSGSDKIVGAPMPAPASPLTLASHGATETPLTLVGAAGQSGNMFDVKSNAGGTIAYLRSDGYFGVGSAMEVGAYVIASAFFNHEQNVYMNSTGVSLSSAKILRWMEDGLPNTTFFARQAYGILRVRQNDGTTTSDGGLVQKGVYVDASNAPAASVVGNVVKKIQAFDAAGNSLGYIAVYDSIN